jgi:hypothetical protein
MQSSPRGLGYKEKKFNTGMSFGDWNCAKKRKQKNNQGILNIPYL